jgi:hypothetical protein
MTDDAQREMEQRALRNVRNLVDTIETQEDDNRRAMRRLVRWVVIGFVVALAVVYGFYRATDRPEKGRTVVIPPPERTAPPAKAP